MFTSLSARFKEIDEYWDRENQYIKDSGIYTPEEVEQILANHEEIRRNQREERTKKSTFLRSSAISNPCSIIFCSILNMR